MADIRVGIGSETPHFFIITACTVGFTCNNVTCENVQLGPDPRKYAIAGVPGVHHEPDPFQCTRPRWVLRRCVHMGLRKGGCWWWQQRRRGRRREQACQLRFKASQLRNWQLHN